MAEETTTQRNHHRLGCIINKNIYNQSLPTQLDGASINQSASIAATFFKHFISQSTSRLTRMALQLLQFF